jgi:hypothetical protein
MESRRRQVEQLVMNSAEVRIIGLSDRSDSIRERLPFAVIEGADVVIRSPLKPTEPLNDHLVWLWNMLKHHRRFLKNLRREGGALRCNAKASGGSVHFLPNAAEMLHLLEMELVLKR